MSVLQYGWSSGKFVLGTVPVKGFSCHNALRVIPECDLGRFLCEESAHWSWDKFLP